MLHAPKLARRTLFVDLSAKKASTSLTSLSDARDEKEYLMMFAREKLSKRVSDSLEMHGAGATHLPLKRRVSSS